MMINLKGIKNIIFDLGGVIINLNQKLTYNAFEDLFPNNFSDLHQQVEIKNLLNRFETGELSSKEFVAFFKEFDQSVSEYQIIQAWNAMLLDLPESRISLIKKMKEKYRVFLLSNTNELHLQHIDNYLKDKYGYDDLSFLFEKVYYSHQLGLRKPNLDIFRLIIEEKKLIPEETLFIDDSKQHIISAKKLNLNVFFLSEDETLTTLFNEY